jgi:AraC-like DNA-binding protein
MAVAASFALIRIAGTKRDGHWDKPAEDDVEDLDALARGAGVGIALLLGAIFWRARPRSQFAWVGLLWSAGVIGYLLWGHSAGLSWPLRVRFALVPLTLMSPFFFWAIVRMVFEDDFQLRAIHWVYFALIEVAGLAQFLLWLSAPAWVLAGLNYGHQLPSLALVVHAIWVVWRGRSTDLVESRARLRLLMLGAVGVTALVLLAAILYIPVRNRPVPVNLAEGVALLLASLTFAALLLRFDPELLPRGVLGAQGKQPIVHANNGGSAIQTSLDLDASGLARLEALMTREEIWRETGLTIGTLAVRAGIPEYRLRRLINQRLGFRNFIAYLNEYRLAAAAMQLADVGKIRTPVLTIALDLGWGSIGPFNRAFRARFGTTPTEFRRGQLGVADAHVRDTP